LILLIFNSGYEISHIGDAFSVSLFAAVRKNLWPQFDFDTWPDNFETMPVFRDLFLTDVGFSFENGDLKMTNGCNY